MKEHHRDLHCQGEVSLSKSYYSIENFRGEDIANK